MYTQSADTGAWKFRRLAIPKRNLFMQPQQLHALRFINESASPLIILHGLLGSSKNWVSIGRYLQSHYDVHLLDLRNHGASFHASSTLVRIGCRCTTLCRR